MSGLPLAPQGVFATVQGEGLLFGEPMVFVRLAGCPVNCPGCDTDYSVAERVHPADIAVRALEARTPGTKWVWVTGGEPAAHDLAPLFAALRKTGMRVAAATSGMVRTVAVGSGHGGCDFLSVSPHCGPADGRWVQHSGTQLNLVPGLNGLRLADWEGWTGHGRFSACWVTPNSADPGTLAECVEFVRRVPGWRLGIQSHLHWNLP